MRAATRGIFAKRTQMKLRYKPLNIRILINILRFLKSRKRTQTNPNKAKRCRLQLERFKGRKFHRPPPKREGIFPKHARIESLNWIANQDQEKSRAMSSCTREYGNYF